MRSRELMRTFTLIFGSSSSLSLFTAQSNSTYTAVLVRHYLLGMFSVFPTHVLLGNASQVIFTGSFTSSAPSSGSSMNARTRTLCRSAISARKISELDVISRLRRQRVERSIRRRGDPTLAHFFI